ncbi:anoctamin-10-like [Rhinophrynus dorsalis]
MGSWTAIHCKCCLRPSVQALAAMQLRDNIKPETKKWLISILEAQAKSGGAHLLVHPGEDDEDNLLLLSATECLLLQATERLGLAKPDHQGSMTAFSYQYKNNFSNSDKLNLFLTLSEKQFLLKHEVESLQVLRETRVPGYLDHRLIPGNHIVHFLQKWGIIVQFYPLHDKEQLNILMKTWYKEIRLTPQPIDAVRAYFGEPVALYFSFLGFFTVSLLGMVLLSYVCAFFQGSLDKHIIFAVFNVLWSTVTMEFWKRHSSTKAYFWGTLHLKSYIKPPRAEFWGSLTKNPITGKLEPHYPQWRRKLRILFVTVPTVCIFLGLAIDGMDMYLYWEKWTRSWCQRSSSTFAVIGLYLPGVCHTIFMEILNAAYMRAATALTEYENHRLESSFQTHLTIKVLVFRFINCFGLLFYITFYLQDLHLLRKRLSSLLIVSQAINQFNESLLPYLKQKLKLDSVWFQKTDVNPYPFIDEVVKEGHMFSYPGLFEDYMELLVQFGYVSLFSCVYPLTAALLIVNNVTEIRTDAFKLCQVFQKPFSYPAASIGVWQFAFETLGFLSVITNCFIVGISPEIQAFCHKNGVGPEKVMLYMLGAEHLLIILKLILAFAIPDKPAWLQLKVMQMEYHSREALKESAR